MIRTLRQRAVGVPDPSTWKLIWLGRPSPDPEKADWAKLNLRNSRG